jgi:D-lyxose ketol-isomerase
MVAGAAASMIQASPAQGQQAAKAMKQYKNSDFYTDGKFNAAAAKEAYYEMMRYYDYPIVDRLKTDDFWALDFGLGNFLEAGMGGIFWVNNKEHNYFGHEIYLLPGQAIPEHKHVKTDVPCKMEGWMPRYGMIYLFGEGAPSATVKQAVPPTLAPYAKTQCVGMLMPGQVAGLAGPEQWHFMKAGPQGAIVTEYATYHDGAGLRFSHPNVKM